MKERSIQLMEKMVHDHPHLACCKKSLYNALRACVDRFHHGGKLLLCGNGGSSCDGEHIVGEMMKGFLLKRKLSPNFVNDMSVYYGEEGKQMAECLQQGIPAISLNAHQALLSATANDINADYIYAQQVVGYSENRDVFLGISTSGNAKNVIYAMQVARVKGLFVIVFCGNGGGSMKHEADIALISPHQKTYQIQEDHIVLYHTLCAMIESEMFEE